MAQLRSNFRNSCRDLKHLVGVSTDSLKLDSERFWSLCPLSGAKDGQVGFQVSYRGEDRCIAATACLAMLLAKIVLICESWCKVAVKDAVLAIPSYIGEIERLAFLDALQIAGINCLQLLHESTAIALAWRMEHRDFSDAEPLVMAFCSCGHSGLLVAIARYEKGAVSILGEAYDRTVGGRDMDRIILDLFAASLEKQGASEPLKSAKSRLKLEEAATKVKKTLSVVDEAKGTAECVVEDIDLACTVKRDDFESRCKPLYEKAREVARNALSAAGLTVDAVNRVEIVGGSCRTPWLQRALLEVFQGHELLTTLNADEAVARGCAWQAGMLSPRVRLEPMEVRDYLHWGGIDLEWNADAQAEAENAVVVDENGEPSRRRLSVFSASDGPSATAEVNLTCRGPFQISAIRVGQDGSRLQVGTWDLDFPKGVESAGILECEIDLNGFFQICAAHVKEGESAKAAEGAAGAAPAEAEGVGAEAEAKVEEAEAAAAADGAPAAEDAAGDAGKAPAAEAEAEAEAASPEGEKAAAEEGEAAAAAGDAPAAAAAGDAAAAANAAEEEEAAEGAEDAPEGTKKTGWWKRWWKGGENKEDANAGANGKEGKANLKGIPVKAHPLSGYDKKSMAVAIEAEKTFRATDDAVIQAENKRNDLESLIFGLQDQLSSGGAIVEWSSEEERASLQKELREAEDWVNEHGEEEATAYAKRHDSLHKTRKMILAREGELANLEEKVKNLRQACKKYKSSAKAPMFDHVPQDQLDEVVRQCEENEKWLEEAVARQAEKKKWEAPVYSSAELMVKTSSLTNFAAKALSVPRPKPAAAEGKDGAGAEADGKDAGKANGDAAAARPPKWRQWRWILGGLLASLVVVASTGIVAGYGAPYGVPSPLGWGASEGDEDEGIAHMAAEIEEEDDTPLAGSGGAAPASGGEEAAVTGEAAGASAAAEL
eukprot:TRINITY_DN11413_c0_g4_i1.p1 TRINITY_DN11413_c0_g4~~TRINITY_DN11413_c0_g4_i1.p1  ORF type:complete len:1034 (-),score=298.44 TRINITY_DN11413_c0_g4_i1:22-2847(-)